MNKLFFRVTRAGTPLGDPNTGLAQLVKSSVMPPIMAALSGVSALTVQLYVRKRR